MSLADELAYTTAAELAARIRRRELSPVEVIDATIARIEARNPDLNAFVFRGYDDARTQAKAAEQAVIDGEALGPLYGVPTAMKDLFDFKPGWPTPAARFASRRPGAVATATAPQSGASRWSSAPMPSLGIRPLSSRVRSAARCRTPPCR